MPNAHAKPSARTSATDTPMRVMPSHVVGAASSSRIISHAPGGQRQTTSMTVYVNYNVICLIGQQPTGGQRRLTQPVCMDTHTPHPLVTHRKRWSHQTDSDAACVSKPTALCNVLPRVATLGGDTHTHRPRMPATTSHSHTWAKTQSCAGARKSAARHSGVSRRQGPPRGPSVLGCTPSGRRPATSARQPSASFHTALRSSRRLAQR